MAVIITDMDMPTQCSQCPFSFRIDNAHTACARNPMENQVEDGDERPKHCPLTEVKLDVRKTVPFKKVKQSAKIPESATQDSAGYDMYAEIDDPVVIEPHKCVMIKSGVAMACPTGYAGFIFARSGLSVKHGLRPATCVSVIDADYRGEIGLPVRNDSDEPRTINPHDRIAQMVFLPILKPEIEIVEELDVTERGDNGFGSTGR